MNTTKIISRIADLLKGETACFDSWYYESDVKLTFKGDTMTVREAWVDLEPLSLILVVTDDMNADKQSTLCVSMSDLASFNQDEVMWLLHEMFYETERPTEIEDWWYFLKTI